MHSKHSKNLKLCPKPPFILSYILSARKVGASISSLRFPVVVSTRTRTAMRLILAKGTSPWATILRTEHGEPAYKTEITDSSSSGGDTTTVYKIPLGQGVRVEPDQGQYTPPFIT
jgi:hypothetical protein